MTQICLSMIVKNEAPLIANALRSVKPFIHAWAIVDTGSTDGTQEIVRKELDSIPGSLEERPWIDFSTNRNQALDLAIETIQQVCGSIAVIDSKHFQQNSPYILVLDADDIMEFTPHFHWPVLDSDGYKIQHVLDTTFFPRVQLISALRHWRYEDPAHEVLILQENREEKIGKIDGVLTRCNVGDRSYKPLRWKRDIKALEKALKQKPNHTRYTFYLAQSYRDSGDIDKALKLYRKRVQLAGWNQEVYCSRLEIAKLLNFKNNRDAALAEYLRAYDTCPDRAEALCHAATLARLMFRYQLAYLLATAASQLPQPNDALFVDGDVYAWRVMDELSLAAFYTGRRSEALSLMRKLCSLVPSQEQERMKNNLTFFSEEELNG